jgi:selenocysteine-specific elongation factor
VIIGTAGHVDHGKTSLVRALTGVDGDRLKEEKARGITIDLGFAYLPLADGRTLGFIDVPGHERFVHTMVAGAAGIDIALLVVAADDGVMPQTREHLAILDLLGTRRGIIALTKVDLATPERLDEVRAQIRDVMIGTALADAEIVSVSSESGEGIDALRELLVSEARSLDERSDEGRFRLAIDRVFNLTGIGLVVTGTMLSGVVHVRDTVRLSPSGLAARVRSVHAQNRPVETARAGDRCALNLAGEDIAKDAIHRGDMVVDPLIHAPTDRVDARLYLLPSEPRPIDAWTAVRLHHGSAEIGARVVPLEGSQLRPGETADVQLVLDRPIAATVLDRFVLRDVSARRTMGGGQFLDLRAPERRRRTPARDAERAAMGIVDPSQSLAALLDMPSGARDLDAFARDRALSAAALDELVDALSPVMLEAPGERTALSHTLWQQWIADLIGRLEALHAAWPDRQGIAREKLRKAVKPELPPGAFLVALQHSDIAGRVRRDGAFVRLASHTMQLSPDSEVQWASVMPLLGGEARFRPPRVRDIAGVLGQPEGEIRELLKQVARMGLVDEVSHDHFFLRATVHEMLQIAADIEAHAPDGWLTAAPFRDRLDCGRKVAILVLEFFDRHGVMLRRGTLRRIQPRFLDLFAPTT